MRRRGFAALGWGAFKLLPQEITPPEDRGVIQIRLTAQQGVNLDYMSKKVQVVEDALADLRKSGVITGVLATVGGGGGVNRATIVASLAPWSERSLSQQEIQADLQKKLANIPGLTVSLQAANSLGIRGGGQGLRFA